MMTYDFIKKLDQQSCDLYKKKRDKNIYEFDLTLWHLVYKLSQNKPEIAHDRFGINDDTIKNLSMASESQLARLASGVLISFKLETPELEIISLLQKDYDPIILIHDKIDALDCTYWLLLKKIASKDKDIAQQIFGVSMELVEKVSNATDNQLRSMSKLAMTSFSLRFNQNLIIEILNENKENPRYLISKLKKIQQSIRIEK